jgi:hypothetical protein
MHLISTLTGAVTQPIDLLGGMLGGVAVLNFFITVDGANAARTACSLLIFDCCTPSSPVLYQTLGIWLADELDAFILHSPWPFVAITLVRVFAAHQPQH